MQRYVGIASYREDDYVLVDSAKGRALDSCRGELAFVTALELLGLIAVGALLLLLAAAVGALAYRAVERARYETALQKSEQRFRQVVEHSPNAKVLVDSNGRIHLVNAQTEALFGWSRQELLGKPVEMLVPERFRSGHPDHRSAFLQRPLSRPMGAGRDLYGLRKDGSESPIEIGLNPLETDEGLISYQPSSTSPIVRISKKVLSGWLRRELPNCRIRSNSGEGQKTLYVSPKKWTLLGS